MPPKKKGAKKDDDWDAGLGETVDPIAQATQAAKDEEAANDAEANGDEAGGGLLAALKKNRGKKAKKGKVVEDYAQGEDPMLEDGADGANDELANLAEKAPQEASMEDEDVFDAPGKKGKPTKPGKGAKKDQPADEEDENLESPGDKLKSKKEKEKEKKEREKARKKEQASKKKTAAPEPKLEEAKPVPTPVADTKVSTETETGAKKKKLPPHLAAIQRQQEELRSKQQEAERLAAEQKQKEEEEERLTAEEQQRKDEAKAAKKQKEKEKVEQQKREGTFMTKAQKEDRAKAAARLQQMVASGAKVEGLDKGAEEKKKPTYDSKKKKPNKKAEEAKREQEELAAEEEARKQMEELRIAREQEAASKAEAERARKEAEDKKAEDVEGEDWEAEADAMDSLKDSWDAPSDEDETPATTKSRANGKPVQPGSTTKGAEIVNGAKVNGDHHADSSGDESSEEESSSEEEEASATQRELARKKQEAAERRERKHEEAMAARSKDDLRSPICCILGHVDTGKTKLLDKVRQTNVQEGEAGGITQQIGATYFPVEALQKKTNVVNKDGSFEFKVPGLLVIDTPGHESFTNLRSRGSSLCNIAILVVDIMHGLEQQTLESMRLLRDKKTPFIVALNKIDRLYGWSRIDNNGFQESLAMQKKSVVAEFERRLTDTKTAFAEQGFNSELYYENKSLARNVSLVPTSAHTGEGIPDMLRLLVTLTQERMTNALMYLSEVECTVLEVKVIEGLGTTIDVVLSNGFLHEGDRIVLCGLNGPISTNIRALLTPAEMKELRVKSQYVHNRSVKAALGVKIAANDLDNAIAGSRLMVVGPDDDEEDLEEAVMSDLENLLGKVSRSGRGVSVQASTLGSLEALLEFLRVSKIPVANISIGPVYKRDVMQAGIMLEKAKEYAVMLCFDVKVDKEAQAYADEVGVKIFTADIIYHLFDEFTKHTAELAERRKEESKLLAVFPCVLKPVAVFNKKEPIVVGVDVVEGTLKMLTPIAAVKNNPITGVKEIINLGRVTSIEREHKQIPLCKRGQPSVAVKIEGANQPLYGRQLEEKDTLYSAISRQSIDVLKEFYRTEVTMEEWGVVKKLKPLFDVP
ncbi:MAG: hypothetical protein M1828_003202 [Chrysothrix sp. TS-e1954]|nr:MAG: hypothetical protein M1828_003202 [Chrysothrix sp. TS-e1954]